MTDTPPEMQHYTVTLNNREVSFDLPPGETVVGPKVLLSETRWNHNTYHVFVDECDGVPESEAPADLDERRGERLTEIDVSVHARLIVQNKRHLDGAPHGGDR